MKTKMANKLITNINEINQMTANTGKPAGSLFSYIKESMTEQFGAAPTVAFPQGILLRLLILKGKEVRKMKKVRINSKKTEKVMRWLWKNDIRHHQTAEFEKGWEVELNNKDAKLLEKLISE